MNFFWKLKNTKYYTNFENENEKKKNTTETRRLLGTLPVTSGANGKTNEDPFNDDGQYDYH